MSEDEISKLYIDLAEKDREISRLTNYLEEERKQKLETEEKYSKLRRAMTELMKDLAVTTSQLKDSVCANGNSKETFSGLEETGNCPLISKRIIDLSTRFNQKCKQLILKRAQLLTNIKTINNALEHLVGNWASHTKFDQNIPVPLITHSEEKRVDSDDSDSSVEVLKEIRSSKRVSVKPIRWVDEMKKDHLSKQQKTENKSPLKTATVSTTQAKFPHGIDNLRQKKAAFYCLCGRKYLYRSQLLEHVKVRTAKKIPCRHCKKVYPDYRLHLHLLSVHNEKVPKFPRKTSVKNFSSKNDKNTQQTQKSSKTSAGIDNARHGKDMSRNRTGYFCLCGKQFKCSNTLSQHIKYFTLESKFPCKTCGRRFIGANYLRKHMIKIHKYTPPQNYEPSFGCRKCGKLFRTMLELTRHQKMKHSAGETEK